MIICPTQVYQVDKFMFYKNNNDQKDFQSLNISEYIATLVNMIMTAKNGYNPDDCSSIYFGLSGTIGCLLPLLLKSDYIYDNGNKYNARDYLQNQLRIIELQTPKLYFQNRNYKIKYVIRCSKVLRAMMTFGNRYGYGPRERITANINVDDLLDGGDN